VSKKIRFFQKACPEELRDRIFNGGIGVKKNPIFSKNRIFNGGIGVKKNPIFSKNRIFNEGISRSHALRGNACLDAPRPARRFVLDAAGTDFFSFPRSAWECLLGRSASCKMKLI
jgi:hypothetical protein